MTGATRTRWKKPGRRHRELQAGRPYNNVVFAWHDTRKNDSNNQAFSRPESRGGYLIAIQAKYVIPVHCTEFRQLRYRGPGDDSGINCSSREM